MAQAWVRPAGGGDAPHIAAIQLDGWRRTYARLLPPAALAELEGQPAVDHWRSSIEDPPSARHRVLVAVADETVVGFSAFCPSADPDLAPAADAELLSMCVRPDVAGRGHGSRLLNAAADYLRDDGFDRAHLWVATMCDEPLRGFLLASGWQVDGATRTLDLSGDGSVTFEQHRLHVLLAP